MLAVSESDMVGLATKDGYGGWNDASNPFGSANSELSPPHEKLAPPDSVTLFRQRRDRVGFTIPDMSEKFASASTEKSHFESHKEVQPSEITP